MKRGSRSGNVDLDQEKRWAKHKAECLARFKEMRRAEAEAKRIAKIPDLEGRRGALALVEDSFGKTFADMVKNFLTALWGTGATKRAKKGLRRELG